MQLLHFWFRILAPRVHSYLQLVPAGKKDPTFKLCIFCGGCAISNLSQSVLKIVFIGPGWRGSAAER